MIKTFTTTGVCAKQLSFELNNGKVTNVAFTGGCNGNLKGIASLIDGMDACEIVTRIKGTDCGGRGTSCPDQLAIAIEQALAE